LREEKTECVQECFYDKELQTCGSCYRTLVDIAEAGRAKKLKEKELDEQRRYTKND